MHKLLLLLLCMQTLPGLSQCPHSIVLSETFGDGWGDGAALLNVEVNGAIVVTGATILNGSTTATYNFNASTGDNITVYLTVNGDGFFATDNSQIEVFDGFGTSLGTGVPDLAANNILAFVGNCPVVTDPCTSAYGDCDGDGILNNVDIDDDNDGIYDLVECSTCPDFYINPQFEEEIVGVDICAGTVDGWCISTDASILGWTSTTGNIEIWTTPNVGGYPASPAGGQWAELNAHAAGTFYQSFCAPEGALLHWSIYHRGRDGTDVMNVRIGPTLATSTIEQVCSTGTIWTQYSGTYTVPAGINNIVIAFEAVSASGGSTSVGNFIDAVSVGLVSSPNCDPDGDGYSNQVDLDSDADACMDVIEASFTDQNDDGLLGDMPMSMDWAGSVVSPTVVDGYTGTNGSVTDGVPSVACTILPVELTGFSLEMVDCSIHTSWTTLSENNSSHFEVERSVNHKNWDVIGIINSTGNTQEAQYYSFLDSYLPKNSTLYYRLSQYDTDGTRTIYPVRSIENSCTSLLNGASTNIYPNPFNDLVKVIAEFDGELSIFSIDGRLVSTRNIHEGENKILFEKLSTGTYLFQIRYTNGKTFTTDLIKL